MTIPQTARAFGGLQEKGEPSVAINGPSVSGFKLNGHSVTRGMLYIGGFYEPSVAKGAFSDLSRRN